MDYALGFLAGMYFTILCIWTQLIVRENKRKAQDYPPRWSPGELGHLLKFRFRDPRDELLFKIQWA